VGVIVAVGDAVVVGVILGDIAILGVTLGDVVMLGVGEGATNVADNPVKEQSIISTVIGCASEVAQ
jgi:hypothetical protein